MTAAAAVYREFLIHTDSWKMTGPRFRIDCSDFRRKLSRETLEKLMIMILGFLGQSLHHRTPPKLSLGCLQTDPGSSLDAPKINSQTAQIRKIKTGNLKTSTIRKDARRQIIEIGLVKNLSTSIACH
jgi:hypothetical protein